MVKVRVSPKAKKTSKMLAKSPKKPSVVKSPKKQTVVKSPKKLHNPEHVAKFLSILFNSREQAHILHLQTNSFAVHKALQKYYDGIVPLVDKYIETYQGKYDIVKGYEPAKKFVEGEKSILPYFKQLEKVITDYESHLPKEVDLQNAYADILDLIHSTNYLLTQLH